MASWICQWAVPRCSDIRSTAKTTSATCAIQRALAPPLVLASAAASGAEQNLWPQPQPLAHAFQSQPITQRHPGTSGIRRPEAKCLAPLFAPAGGEEGLGEKGGGKRGKTKEAMERQRSNNSKRCQLGAANGTKPASPLPRVEAFIVSPCTCTEAAHVQREATGNCS